MTSDKSNLLLQLPSNEVRTWFSISIDGGEEKTFDGNSISMQWEVLPSSETGTPMDISYKADFSVGSYSGCTASYNGQETAGSPMAGDGHDLGETSAKCVMNFGL